MLSDIDRKMRVNSYTQREQTIKETVKEPRVTGKSKTNWSVPYCLQPAVLHYEVF